MKLASVNCFSANFPNLFFLWSVMIRFSEAFYKFTRVPNWCGDWLEVAIYRQSVSLMSDILSFSPQMSCRCLVSNWQLPQMTINWSRDCSSSLKSKLTSKTASHKPIQGCCRPPSFCIWPWPKISDRLSQATIHCLSICHFLKAEIFIYCNFCLPVYTMTSTCQDWCSLFKLVPNIQKLLFILYILSSSSPYKHSPKISRFAQ